MKEAIPGEGLRGERKKADDVVLCPSTFEVSGTRHGLTEWRSILRRRTRQARARSGLYSDEDKRNEFHLHHLG